jgi:hypothetical protein
VSPSSDGDGQAQLALSDALTSESREFKLDAMCTTLA